MKKSVIQSFLMIWARSAGAEAGCHYNFFYFVKKDFRLHPSRKVQTSLSMIKIFRVPGNRCEVTSSAT